MSKIQFTVDLHVDDKNAMLAASEFFARLANGSEDLPSRAKLVKAPAKARVIQVTGSMANKTEPAKTEPAKTEPAKTEPAKTEPAKTEPAKTEPAKTEPAKTEPAKTVTLEEIRDLGFTKVRANTANKAKIGAWLKERAFKAVPTIPEDKRAEYKTFLATL